MCNGLKSGKNEGHGVYVRELHIWGCEENEVDPSIFRMKYLCKCTERPADADASLKAEVGKVVVMERYYRADKARKCWYVTTSTCFLANFPAPPPPPPPHAPCAVPCLVPMLSAHAGRVLIGAWDPMLWPIWGFRYMIGTATSTSF